MLDRLEAAGLVERSPSPDDRRAWLVGCSAEGRALESRYAAVSAKMTALFYAGMERCEIAAFESSLRKIVANLARAEDGGAA